MQVNFWDTSTLVNLKDCPGLVLRNSLEFLRASARKSRRDFLGRPLRGKFCNTLIAKFGFIRQNSFYPRVTAFLLVSWFLSFSLILMPALLTAEESPAEQEDKISLELKSVDILELIRILSLKTHKTIVPSRNVSGRVTVFLNNVTFQDVLDIILISQNLASEIKGDIIYIMTNAEYKAIYGKDCLEPRKMEVVKLNYSKPSNVFNAISQIKSDIGKIVADEASGTLILIDIPEKLEFMKRTIKEIDAPLETVVYDLNYVKAADAKTQISLALTPGTGEVIVDERSGKAIISDLPQKMEKIKNLMKEIDEEARQVFIEADIIQITLSDSFKRGIDWEKVFNEGKLHGLDFVGYFPVSPALSSYQKISVGTVDGDKYKAIVNLLSTYGNTEILSQPRIAVVNKEESNIMVGVRDAYVTQTLSQAESTTVTSEQIEFVDVGIKLKVIPTIGKDGFITMKIKPEVSSVREIVNTALNSRIPIVQTSEVESVIKVKDGVTVMLGGLLECTNTEEKTGIPVLSRLPVLGKIFGSRSKEKEKTELVIFITPHLIKGDTQRKGTEPENFIPSQFLSGELRNKVIRRKLEEFERGEADKLGAGVKKEVIPEADSKVKSKIKPEVKPEAKPKTKKTAKVEKVPDSKEPGVSAPKPSLTQNKTPYKFKEKVFSAEVAGYYKKGLEFHEAGNLDAAISAYNEALLADKNCAPVYNQLGIVYESKRLLDKAEENYMKALEADPEYLPTYSNLAFFNEARNNTEKAAHYWRQRAMLGNEDDPWVKAALERLAQIKTSQKNGNSSALGSVSSSLRPE